MALTNRLTNDRFPYIPLRLTVKDRTFRTEALLDTGFDGDAIVPAGLIGQDTQPDSYVTWTLADGSTVLAASYLGSVELEGLGRYPVLVSVLGDEPLVGRGFSDRFRIVLDHGVRLTVEP